MFPHFTIAPESKLEPLTVNVKAVPPAVAEEGDRLLLAGADALIVNVVPGDVPAEVVTVTIAVPAVAVRPAGTTAVSWVALT